VCFQQARLDQLVASSSLFPHKARILKRFAADVFPSFFFPKATSARSMRCFENDFIVRVVDFPFSVRREGKEQSTTVLPHLFLSSSIELYFHSARFRLAIWRRQGRDFPPHLFVRRAYGVAPCLSPFFPSRARWSCGPSTKWNFFRSSTQPCIFLFFLPLSFTRKMACHSLPFPSDPDFGKRTEPDSAAERVHGYPFARIFFPLFFSSLFPSGGTGPVKVFRLLFFPPKNRIKVPAVERLAFLPCQKQILDAFPPLPPFLSLSQLRVAGEGPLPLLPLPFERREEQTDSRLSFRLKNSRSFFLFTTKSQ